MTIQRSNNPYGEPLGAESPVTRLRGPALAQVVNVGVTLALFAETRLSEAEISHDTSGRWKLPLELRNASTCVLQARARFTPDGGVAGAPVVLAQMSLENGNIANYRTSRLLQWQESLPGQPTQGTWAISAQVECTLGSVRIEPDESLFLLEFSPLR